VRPILTSSGQGECIAELLSISLVFCVTAGIFILIRKLTTLYVSSKLKVRSNVYKAMGLRKQRYARTGAPSGRESDERSQKRVLSAVV